ncbi:MAG: iron-containing alcohol dehydrogenase [Lachnospiraceae bacterium]|nr:iron-containing alcohol dehydrogenase [Lachnospiraceae bacterium]
MKFYMPVRVYDEDECVKAHAKDIAALGNKALIVTGKHSAFANGSFDDVAEVLNDVKIEYSVFSEVEENPSVETVFAAKDKYASAGIDLVIGIGGGSPMDAAKAIALVLKHPEADPAYLYDKEKDASSLPIVCVPTTCGTGSEVTGVSVLTRHDKKTKISMVHKVFPTLALIDGKYLKGASQTLIVNSAMDALSHLYESVINAKADDYVRMTAAAGLKTWAKIKDVLSGAREMTKEDAGILMRASALAGMSIAGSGTSLPHALSYALTYDLSLPHGRAVGYFLPAFMEAAPAGERDELLNLSGFESVEEFRSFTGSVFGEQDVPAEELKRTYELVSSNAAKMKSASFTVDEEVLKQIVFWKK